MWCCSSNRQPYSNLSRFNDIVNCKRDSCGCWCCKYVIRKKINIANITPSEVPSFPFGGQLYQCKVDRVYDGDTIYVVFIHNNTPFKYGIRIAGIDTAEVRSTNRRIKAFAMKTRDHVIDIVPPGSIAIGEFRSWDKFGGRIVGDFIVTISDASRSEPVVSRLSTHLLKMNFAVKYSGKSKKMDNDAWLAHIDAHI